MSFADIIARWPSVPEMAADLGLPAKNVRRWVDVGSIPAGWFIEVARAAKRRGYAGVTTASLCQVAHDQRLLRPVPEAANDARPQADAA